MNKRINQSSFLFAKGIFIILILAAHINGLISLDSYRWNTYKSIISLLGKTANISFFIISGYFLIKRPFFKCLKISYKSYIVPYIITAILFIIVFPICHFCFFGYLPDAIKETTKYLLAFIFGLAPGNNVVMFGMKLYDCSVVHFLLESFFSAIIVNEIIKIKNEIIQYVLIFLCVVFGAIFTNIHISYYCISNFLSSGVLYVFTGYKIKEKKIFEKMGDKAYIYICFVAIVCLFVFKRTLFNSFICIILCFLLISLISINLSNNNSKIVSTLKLIGSNTPIIICIHAIENVSIPWYLWTKKIASNIVPGTIIEFVIRLMIINICCIIVKKIIKTRYMRKIENAK